MAKNDYRRSLIMLRGLEKGYGGHARLERRVLTGTLDFTVSAPSGDETLAVALVGPRGGRMVAKGLGRLKPDGRGQRALLASFDPRNVAGLDLNDTTAALIARVDENGATPVLCGWINGAKAMDWTEARQTLSALLAPPNAARSESADGGAKAAREIAEAKEASESAPQASAPDGTQAETRASGAREDADDNPSDARENADGDPANARENAGAPADARRDVGAQEMSRAQEDGGAQLDIQADDGAEPEEANRAPGDNSGEARARKDGGAQSDIQADERAEPEEANRAPGDNSGDARAREDGTAQSDIQADDGTEPEEANRAPGDNSGDARAREDGGAQSDTRADDGAEPEEANRAPGDNSGDARARQCPAGAYLDIDMSEPWPEDIESLRLLFLTQPRYEPFERGEYVFVRAAMAQETGIDHCAVGVLALSGKIAGVCYAIPMAYSPEPPPGLEGYEWIGDQNRGWWITCDDMADAGD